MTNEFRIRQMDAVLEIAGTRALVLIGPDNTLHYVEAPQSPKPSTIQVGQTYHIHVWPNGAETVLSDDLLALVNKYHLWGNPRFMKIKVDSIDPFGVAETAIVPDSASLNERHQAGDFDEWFPAGNGWRGTYNEEDDAYSWFRVRTWGVYE